MTAPSPELAERALSPHDVVAAGLCIGCGACVADSGGRGRMRFDPYGQLRPDGPDDWFRARTTAFARTCPFSPDARNEDEIAAAQFPHAPFTDPHIGRHAAAYVGAAQADGYRERGSSGGLTSWTAARLLQDGLVDAVAHVAPTGPPAGDERMFRYRISRSTADLQAGAKSRYYPIELSQVLAEIRAAPGRYAVVAIPCFAKAIRLKCAEDPVLSERVAFILGLFCGHMKSARMVESFAWQMGAAEREVRSIDFRVKDPSRPANWYTTSIGLKRGGERRLDWWHMADGDWGAGFFQAPACDFCDDVVAETADASFGDAWVEPYSSDGRGVNVVVVRSPTIDDLMREAVQEAAVELEPVDAEFVRATQAAGFRHRREGLALRLSRRRGLVPRKRVPSKRPSLPWRRRAVYRMRRSTSIWSHRVFWLARELGAPRLYLSWARATLAAYRALTYSRGPLGAALDRLESSARRGGERR